MGGLARQGVELYNVSYNHRHGVVWVSLYSAPYMRCCKRPDNYATSNVPVPAFEMAPTTYISLFPICIVEMQWHALEKTDPCIGIILPVMKSLGCTLHRNFNWKIKPAIYWLVPYEFIIAVGCGAEPRRRRILLFIRLY